MSAAAALAAAAAAAAFNLVCAGTERSGPIGLALPEASGAPVAIEYRIDLDRGLWCSGACPAAEPVATVFEGVIVLREWHYPSGSHVIMVTPATGRFTDTRIDGNRATLRSGRCRPAPFTGLSGSVTEGRERRMGEYGSESISQEAFIAALRMGTGLRVSTTKGLAGDGPQAPPRRVIARCCGIRQGNP